MTFSNVILGTPCHHWRRWGLFHIKYCNLTWIKSAFRNNIWLYWYVIWKHTTINGTVQFIENCCFLVQISLEFVCLFVPNYSADQSTFIKILALHWTDDKPWSEPMLNCFTDAHMPHSASGSCTKPLICNYIPIYSETQLSILSLRMAVHIAQLPHTHIFTMLSRIPVQYFKGLSELCCWEWNPLLCHMLIFLSGLFQETTKHIQLIPSRGNISIHHIIQM